MPLSHGSRLGPYEILALLGQGGMGEVYRATDTRLGRTVAVKVLPAALAADPERRQRLEREARIAGSLNHPHICTLYDIGEERLPSDRAVPVYYLVMEYIEGTTLEHRLAKGRLPHDQVLTFAVQIADALDKAHRRGVVHRDLKPANVMLTPSGAKLVDFGLATQTTPTRGSSSQIATEHHPDRITAEGTVVGTLQYMAPEQLEGRHTDARTDIFAFGALVYEMITGSRAFQSVSQAGLIGTILRDDPRPVDQLAPDAPPALVRTIARCLSKDPDDRWQTANDLFFQLRSIIPASTEIGRIAGPIADDTPRRNRALWIAGLVASLLAAIVVTFFLTRGMISGPVNSGVDTPPTRFSLFPVEGTSFYSGYDKPFALSPNGRAIVYVGVKGDGSKQLWLRLWEADLAQPISGTDGASMPFWSPDGLWIGFFADNSLRKVRVSGGVPQTIANGVSTFAGATWSSKDVIVFLPGSPTSGLARVSAQGGAVSPVTTPGPKNGAGGHVWPRFLADGEHFLYSGVAGGGDPAALYVASVGNEPPKVLMQVPPPAVAVTGEYAPGYILFSSPSGALFARPFDEARLEVSGEPVRLIDGIPISGPGRWPVSLSANGVLAYWPYAVGTPAVLRWFDRTGRVSDPIDAPARYIGFSVSPDSRQLTFSRVRNDGTADLWLRDLTRGTEARLTTDHAMNPLWSPDGARIAYSAARTRPPDLFIRNIAAGNETRVNTSPPPDFPSSWSPDGKSLVAISIESETKNDLWIWNMQDGREATGERLSFNTGSNESDGRVAPDGRWIAYVTDESGSDEVWVAKFPSGSDRTQVSVGGGTSPAWGAGSAEIFYISKAKQLMTTAFKTGEVGTPQALFGIESLVEFGDRIIYPASNTYVAAANGQRFLVAVRAQDPNAPPIGIVQNWPALLKK